MKTLTFITIALLALSGCNDEQKKEVKQEIKQEAAVYTVEYYTKHKDLRERRLKECKALVKATPLQMKDCDNAAKADLRSKRFKYGSWE